MTIDKCKKCGRCCYFMCDGKLKKCKHLVWITKNRGFCRIYKNPKRIGMVIDRNNKGHTIHCTYRDNVDLNYKDCPYNKEGQKTFDEVYLG